MKRQTLLKSTLCLLMALLCNVTWAAVTVPETGVYTIEGGKASEGHRGFLAAGENYSNYPVLSNIRWSNYASNSTRPITNGEHWYVKKNSNGTFYIYNLGLCKFIAAGTGSNIDFSDTPYEWQIVVNGNNNNYNSIRDNGLTTYLCFACGKGAGQRNVHFNNQESDGGSMHTFTVVEDGETTYAEQIFTVSKFEAKALVAANADKLGTGIGQAHFLVDGVKKYTAADINTAIDAANTADEVNAIVNSLHYNIPEKGIPYYLYDETRQVYVDIHHLGSWSGTAGTDNMLATVSADKQCLYITGSETDGTWKIHTTAEGGNYLHYSSVAGWNSRVSSEGEEFKWTVEVVASDNELRYMLKNVSGPNKGYLGRDFTTNGKELFVDQNDDNKKLTLKLVEAREVPFLTVNNLDAVTYPYALSDKETALVFGRENLTVAMEITMGTSTSGDEAFICASDISVTSDNTTYDNTSTFVAVGTQNKKIRYYASAKSGGYYTGNNEQLIASRTHKVVIVMDKAGNVRKTYVDGIAATVTNYQDFNHFKDNANAKLFIGGGKNSAGNKYGFSGKVHSVQFYNAVLTEEEIAAIEYPITDKQQEVVDRTVKVYAPGNRAITLENGKKYMIYNTTFNNSEDRTGFLYDNGAGIGHTGSPKKKPSEFKTTNNAFLWEVVTTDEEGKYYLKLADGGYVNATGKTDNAEPQVLYIQPWNTSTTTKAGVKSEGADGTVNENANIGADVFTIGGTKVGNTGQDCWNGNPDTWAKWESAHPYAFYEAEEVDVVLPEGSPLPGHTYYIYCDNDTRQYFYNDGGTLKVSNKRVEWSNEYLFDCTFDGKYFQFKNKKGKYLGFNQLQNNPYNYEINKVNKSGCQVYAEGNVNLWGVANARYVVMQDNGNFSYADKTYNKITENYSTDFRFEEFVFPVHGEVYYIYSDTYYGGEYVNRYMYADGGNLKTNVSLSLDPAYQWTCIVTDDGYVQFKNGNGKYLKHQGVQDAAYNFTLNKYNSNHPIAATLYSVGASRYFVVKNDGSSFDQSTSTYNQTSAEWCTDFVFMPVKDVKVLAVEGRNWVGATATWNGETKPLPASWVVTPQVDITSPVLTIDNNEGYTFTGLYEGETLLGETVEIASLTANRSIVAQFAPDFFSTTYGQKWVRLQNCINTSYWANAVNNEDGGYKGKTGTLDYADVSQLWCLVGTTDNFVLYNKATGENLMLKVPAATYANGSEAIFANDANATWKIKEKDFGFAFVPTHNDNPSELGINMYGGNGGDLKLYETGDDRKGSYWTVEMADVENPLILNIEVDQVWESSPRVAELTFTINGAASTRRILSSVEGQTLYLPVGATYEVSSMTYRGYTYNGYTDVDGVLTASYTANDERTLFYSPRDGHPYRIPAIATAPNGDIFAICDYRPCGNDIGYGEVDLVCRVSSDNGVTWTEEKMIADGRGDAYAANDTSKIWQVGFGDPAIVADRESNKVLVMSVCGNQTCWDGTFGEANQNPNRVARLYITYDEEKKEWVYGEPEEVTYSIYPKFVDKDGNVHAASLFIGAGKICQSRVVKKGDYYRLYCAVWNVTKSIRTHHNYVIYSDDFGQTWNVLGELGKDANPNQPGPAFGGNEPKCEELPDGTVVLSSRKGGGRYFNLFTFDNEGKTEEEMYTTGSWGTVASSNDIAGGLSFGGNSTNGEIYKVKAIRKEDGKICDVMLQSVPTGGGRDNVAIFYKEMEYNDDGTNKYTPQTFSTGWTKGIHVSTKGSCYSTMILQADGRLGFFFEEEPGGYCMVYIPYTIEDVTDDKYSLYTVNSTIGQYGVGTFYASEAMQIPEGVKAYVATEEPEMKGADAEGNATGVITMTELEGIIPAHTGAVLRGNADTYNFIPSISYGTTVENNMLVGYEGADNKTETKKEVTLADGYTTYVLTVKDGAAGFYRKDADFNVYNNKAYLQVPAAVSANALRIRIEGEQDDYATEIVMPVANGQQPTAIYDLTGRRVQKVQKGLYIVNGKKVWK